MRALIQFKPARAKRKQNPDDPATTQHGPATSMLPPIAVTREMPSITGHMSQRPRLRPAHPTGAVPPARQASQADADSPTQELARVVVALPPSHPLRRIHVKAARLATENDRRLAELESYTYASLGRFVGMNSYWADQDARHAADRRAADAARDVRRLADGASPAGIVAGMIRDSSAKCLNVAPPAADRPAFDLGLVSAAQLADAA